ncbi:alpha/beta hydrolase [Rhodococcus sp. NPDC058514]|uniref:alpha/beta hydrolase n=1 Tax=unclassified Rhodococcus (in: high G+C Gram-positive bacteria) TaxID=192944 RepID=UPI0036609768
MTSPLRRTWPLAVVLALCCACGAGPSVRPDVAVAQRPGEMAAQPDDTEVEPPPLEIPRTELDWTDCTRITLDTLGLGPGPEGLIIECAQLAAPIDAAATIPGTFSLGVSRARIGNTPVDAGPLVLTSGSDRSSTATLAALAAGPITDLLAARPVVAVDRRGIGTSTLIECIDSIESPGLRQEMLDLGQFSPPDADGGDAADKVMALSRDATVACTDFLQPQELAFDAAHAADDLEQLRTAWGVERLGLLATGNGSAVALAYATKHPDGLSRLVLDAPGSVRADAVTAAESRVAGQEAALAAFARQCAALACSLGPDPRSAVADLVRRASAGELAPVSSNGLLTALTGFLGAPRGDQQARVREFADLLSAAGRGDIGPLESLVGHTAAATDSDGQFIARCSDGRQWPTPGRVRELRAAWAEQYPVFGPDAALALLLCTAWPTTPPQDLPSSLDATVLVLSGVADPIVGSAGAGSVTGTVAAAGAANATVAWLGSGHPVSTHSGCGQLAIAVYARTGVLPPDGGACPG